MSQKLLIKNLYDFHYEIIESVIVKYHEILNIDSDEVVDIYLVINNNNSFKNYITNKYPQIRFKDIKDYDYYINCTIYDRDFDKLDNNKNSVKRYISHKITKRLKTNPNILFLTPLSKDRYISAEVLPYSENKKKSSIPIYVIQGKLNQ